MTFQQLKYVITVAETGTITEAAGKLYVSQPSLTKAIHELEKEMNIVIFNRTNKGISLSREGDEFLGYARQVLDQAAILEDKYKGGHGGKKKFCVSTQHYSFAVKAFVETVKKAGMDSYEFAANETTTYDVMENVRNFKSEIGVLYLNDFNEQVLMKIIREKGLEFEELFACDTYVYLWSGHPLAGQSVISMEELAGYMKMEFSIPARGLIGFRNELLTTTRGTGIMYHVFQGYAPYKGDIPERTRGSLVAFEAGVTTAYGLNSILDRGELFLEPGVEVYEGMIVGENSRDQDMDVNPCKKKHLTNTRASGSDEAIKLPPCRKFTLESALEWINDDELVEVTPKSIRMRKMVLSRQARYKNANVKKSQQ